MNHPISLTLIIKKGTNDYLIGQIKELPGVLTQGKTEEEVRENIWDALDTYLESMREEDPDQTDIISTESLTIA